MIAYIYAMNGVYDPFEVVIDTAIVLTSMVLAVLAP